MSTEKITDRRILEELGFQMAERFDWYGIPNEIFTWAKDVYERGGMTESEANEQLRKICIAIEMSRPMAVMIGDHRDGHHGNVYLDTDGIIRYSREGDSSGTAVILSTDACGVVDDDVDDYFIQDAALRWLMVEKDMIAGLYDEAMQKIKAMPE